MTATARSVCSRWFDEMTPGLAFETFGRTITEYDLVAFGALTGDTNPQHLDRRFAEAATFGQRVVHGALVMSYALGLVPIDAERLIALRQLRSVKFKAPVFVGDSIRVLGRVESCSELDAGHGVVVLGARVVNQDDRLVARAEIETVWASAPVREAAA